MDPGFYKSDLHLSAGRGGGEGAKKICNLTLELL